MGESWPTDVAGFANPIIGGAGALIRPAIISPDWDGDPDDPATSPGTVGWGIFRNGHAVLNDATIRGDLVAGSISLGTDAWHVDSSGNMWWGTEASYAAAVIEGDPSISSAGVAVLDSATLTAATVTGTINATSGDLGTLDISGTLTMTGSGRISTASSGRRLELSSDSFVFGSGTFAGIAWYSGLASETAHGEMGVGTSASSGGNPFFVLHAPEFSGQDTTGQFVLSGSTTRLVSGYVELRSYGSVDIHLDFNNDDATSYFAIYENLNQRLRMSTGTGMGMEDGSASAPAWTFQDDLDTGMFRPATNTIGFATGGTERARITSAGDLFISGDYLQFNDSDNGSVPDSIRHNGNDFQFRANAVVIGELQRHTNTRASYQVIQETINNPSSGYLGFRWAADLDTGLYRHGTNQFGISAGGAATLVGTSTGVAINNSTATGTGTNCDLVSASVNGASMYAIRRDTSMRKHKTGIKRWGLTDEQFMAIRPRSFIWKGQYVGPDGRIGTTIGRDVDDTIPEGSHLLRRAGFVYEELAAIDLHLIGHEAVDWKAIAAANVEHSQRLTKRLAEAEARLRDLERTVSRLVAAA